MAMHGKRFTLNKIKSRLKIIESQVIRDRQPIGQFRCFEHKDASENPFVAAGFDDSNWQAINPPAYWGKWNANFTLRTRFTVPDGWENSSGLLPMEVSLRPDFSNLQSAWERRLSPDCEKMQRCVPCLNRLRSASVDDLVNMAKEFTFAIRPLKNEDGCRLWYRSMEGKKPNRLRCLRQRIVQQVGRFWS
jgi:hypothetical protein